MIVTQNMSDVTPATTPSAALSRRGVVAAVPTLGALALGAAVLPSSAALATAPRDRLLPGRASMMRTVEHLVSLAPRATGTPGGRRAAEYVAERFRRAGLDEVYIEPSVSYSWEATEASLEIAGRRIRQHPVSFSFIGGPEATGRRTLGPDGLEAEVVDLGGLPLSALAGLGVAGKIVMVDLKFLTPLVALTPFMEFINDPDGGILDAQTLLSPNPYITTLPQTIDALQAAGAAGMIGVLADYFESDRYHNEYYRRSPMTIPGMWVTRREAARVRRLLAEEPTATMRMTTVRRKVVARQPIGILYGTERSPDAAPETVMVQSHHDSLGPGAVEDGTGTSQVVALAEYYGGLARRGRRSGKTLMFTTFDTHFTGYHAHMHFVDAYVKDPATPYRIVANLTIEHVAKKGRIGPDRSLQLLDEPEPRGYFENLSLPGKAMLIQALLDHDLGAATLLNATPLQPVGIPTDASFVMAAGVPTASLIAGPIYLYDEADDLDAVAQDQLVPVLRANRDIVDWMLATPSDRIGLLPAVPGLT